MPQSLLYDFEVFPCCQHQTGVRVSQIKLIKIGGRLVRDARRLVFQLAEVVCLGTCSGECWSVSVGSIQHQCNEYP